jgi:hypothetical protein
MLCYDIARRGEKGLIFTLKILSPFVWPIFVFKWLLWTLFLSLFLFSLYLHNELICLGMLEIQITHTSFINNFISCESWSLIFKHKENYSFRTIFTSIFRYTLNIFLTMPQRCGHSYTLTWHSEQLVPDMQILSILWNHKVYGCGQETLPLQPILRKTSPVLNFTFSYNSNFYVDTVFQSKFMPQTGLFPMRFSIKTTFVSVCMLHALHISCCCQSPQQY